MAKQITMTILRFIFMLQLFSMALGQFTCNRFTDCSTSVAGDFVPDSHDCEQYYVCVEQADGTVVPSLIPLHCDPGLYFDHTNKTCIDEAITGECINLCQNLCPNGCSVTDGSLAAVRGDCSQYYICLLSPIQASCVAPNLYFNGTACVADSSQCCDFCEPYCERGGMQIQDPCDCTSYYVCTGEGEPSEGNRGTCDSGSFYDEGTASCLAGQCNNFCSVEQCSVFRKRSKIH